MGLPSGPVEAGLYAVAVAGGLMWLGFGLTGLVPAWRGEPVTRWALAFPAVVLFALLLMLAHILTRGALLASPAAVRVVTALVAVALVVRWVVSRSGTSEKERRPKRDLLLAAACSLLVAVVWGSPVFRMLPLATSGDAGMHAGWTEQLMNGEEAPSGALTGDIPNYYPWLYHALLALVTHFTPGGHAYLGFAPLHLLQVAGVAAALFGIGHVFAGRWAGAAVSVLGSATGGWGFLVAREPGLVIDPRAEAGAAGTRYLGDLIFVRSYNASFMNLAPPYPRDVALALLVGALLAMARAGTSRRDRDYVFAGTLLGMVGLTQLDPFFVGLLTAVALALWASRGRRLRTAAALLVPALALVSLWAIPIAVSYVRLGGFVDTTIVPPVDLPAWAVLGAWGIVTPLAVVGGLRALRLRDQPVVRVIAASLAAALVALATAAVGSVVAGGGFETLGRQHRYWPLVCLALALLAGLGAHALAAAVASRSQAAAWAVAVLVVALAVPSPVLAGLALPSELPLSSSVTRALQGDPNQALNALSEYGDGVCSAAVAFPLTSFSYTGFRFVLYRWHRWQERGRNAARIRWAGIYERIVPQRRRVRDNRRLMRGSVTPEELREIARRYSLDVVVAPSASAAAEAFGGLRGRPVYYDGEQYVLYGLGRC